MRVLLVSSGSGSRGGGEIFLDYLGRELADRGHDVSVWIPNHPRMDELAEKCARFARIVRSKYRNTYDLSNAFALDLFQLERFPPYRVRVDMRFAPM